MKNTLLALACLLPLAAQAEKFSTYADSPGTAVGFATSVVEYTPGTGASGDGAIQASALGAPDGTNLSLGKKGSVVLKVGPNALNANGTSAADLYVYEGGWWDSFDVYVSSNGANYTKLTATTTSKASAGTGSWLGFNIDGQVDSLLSYPYIKVIDTSNSSSTVPGTDGADLDGIMITSAASPVGNLTMYDTDALAGTTYNLYQDTDTGVIGVKMIASNGAVSYVPFSSDNTLTPVALSVHSDVNGDSVNDLDVLVTRKSDGAQLNIYREQSGALIKTIDNSAIK